MVLPIDGDKTLVKIFGWYDNEWGYSNRLVDLVALVGIVIPRASRSSRTCRPSRAGACSCASTSTCRSATPGGNRVVTDDFRMRQAIPTLRWLLDRGAAVTCVHPPRPARRAAPDPRFDVAPVRARLAELVPGVELIENLRFDPGEEANDPAFVDELVAGHDCYVNDAFGASHRAHASIVGPPTLLPSAAGRLLAREVEVIGGLLDEPEHALRRRRRRRQGGRQARRARGAHRQGRHRARRRRDGVHVPRRARDARSARRSSTRHTSTSAASCSHRPDKIMLPSDVVVLGPGGTLRPGADSAPWATRRHDRRATSPTAGGASTSAPRPAHRFADVIAGAGTVLWNGPMGVFEDPRFAPGPAPSPRRSPPVRGSPSSAGATAPRRSTSSGSPESIDFVSTGGGASLELIELGDLPGLAALRGAPNAPGGGLSAVAPERGVLVSGNWKMNHNHFEALKLVQELAALLSPGRSPPGREVSVHPPFTDLRTVQTAVESDHVPVGARRAELLLRGPRRVHRRGLAPRCSPS